MTSCAKLLIGTALLGIASISAVLPASGEALLLIEVDSGKVLQADNATYPWYPASLTKLMTLYVTLQAIREKRIAQTTMTRFNKLISGAIAAGMVVMATSAFAQIAELKIIAPAAPGGGWDSTARSMRSAVTALGAEDKAVIERLCAGGKTIAAAIALKSGDCAWGWKVAYDEAFADFSPGILAVAGLTETLLADPGIVQADSCAGAHALRPGHREPGCRHEVLIAELLEGRQVGKFLQPPV